MKKWKRILALLFCLCFAQALPVFLSAPLMVQAAEKSGLQKENGKYYYYSGGKKVKNKWESTKEMTAGGQTVTYRYYFGSNGAAYAGKRSGDIMTPAVKKISRKYYGFDELGRMLTGLYVKNGLFYYFDPDSGVFDKAKSAQLRSASKEGEKYAPLIQLLRELVGSPKKKQTGLDSCYGDGTDQVYSYDGFDVALFKDRKTEKITVVSITVAATEAAKDTASGAKTEVQETTDNTEDLSEDGKHGLRLVKDKYYYYYDKNGERIKNKWKTINGYRYYFGSNGRALTTAAKVNGTLYVFRENGRLSMSTGDHFVKVADKWYFVNRRGVPYTGWRVIDGALYYAGSDGVLAADKTTDGISFDSTGRAKDGTSSQLKMLTMQIVSSITNSRMSQSQKLRACWNYVVGGRFYYAGYYPNLGQSGWQRQEALRMLRSRGGNCYGFACAFAALANEVGYTPYVIAGRVSGSRDGAADGLTRHAWVQINGGNYDPEAQYAGWYAGVYGTGYGVAHQIQQRVRF